MKKLISVLLCICVLFSCAVFASAEEAPQLKVSTNKVLADDLEEHYCFSLVVKNCIKFESLELLITYNPDVLEYSKVFPYAMPDEYRHLISCTVEDAGKLRVTAYCWDLLMCGHIEKIEPFCFNFIGTGDTDVAVELVSFKTADGEVENVKFDADIQNFTVEEAPQLTLKTGKMWAAPYDSDAGQYASFRFAVVNCPDFESFRAKITYNPEVLEPYHGYPSDLEQIIRNSIDLTKESDGTLIVDGLKHQDAYKGDFDPFCFKVIGKGDTDISVELVSFKTADGAVENVNFDATVYNFTVTQVYVKYDLDGNEAVTAEDARLALRFAVGLDTFTDDQRYAAGLVRGSEFTSALARSILRYAVGLPA